ncbi:interleukin-11 receptor subunit alpha isoform X2 [Chanos chanos]|uniref:Interleukin-11 receptor subunit alpha isoform X2 n=1 Tax=Chanos chanos TaxID=29144 RepID=A0A6J2UUY2_CHACN|nr:interleukin-11 receptor subunit alpha-like isoform X2 [Chanos chanos]
MPGLVSCPGGLIVIGIISLSFVHIHSEIWSNEVSDVQFGRLGSKVTLVCRGTHGGSLVEWRLNGSSVIPWQTLSSGGSLTLLNAQLSMEGNYTCHDHRGALLQTIKLRLGNLPGFLNVSCHVPNHYKIFCSWKQTVNTNLPTKYISSYSTSKGVNAEPCVQEQLGVNECTITDHYFWDFKHLVNITEINPLGSESTIIRVNIHKLLKPDPPEAVTPEEVEGQPSYLLVHWRAPASWPDMSEAFPLTFSLRYRPVGSNYWSTLQTEENTSMMITDALAGHMHHIQVRAQDALINYSQWSEWSHVVQAQPWSEPLANTEEPTEEPSDDTVFIPSIMATDKLPDPSADDSGSLGLLIFLGLFAGVITATVFTILILLRVRQQRRNSATKQELASMVKMKSLPI